MTLSQRAAGQGLQSPGESDWRRPDAPPVEKGSCNLLDLAQWF